MGISKYLREAWKKPKKAINENQRERLQQWRREHATVRVDYPTRLDRARSLGYKAKQGIIVVRQRVPKGGYMRVSPVARGRKPKNVRWFKVLGKNMSTIAEERAVRSYPNMEVLNSYYVGEDGKHKWYEVILVDKNHPGIKADKDLKWIAEKQHNRRVHRGLTSAGKKARGLRRKGKGAEKVRPSVRANKGRTK